MKWKIHRKAKGNWFKRPFFYFSVYYLFRLEETYNWKWFLFHLNLLNSMQINRMYFFSILMFEQNEKNAFVNKTIIVNRGAKPICCSKLYNSFYHWLDAARLLLILCAKSKIYCQFICLSIWSNLPWIYIQMMLINLFDN